MSFRLETVAHRSLVGASVLCSPRCRNPAPVTPATYLGRPITRGSVRVGEPDFIRQALAFLYRQKFGRDAPDYIVQSIVRDYGAFEIRSDGLESALNDGWFIEQLTKAYAKATRFEWDARPEQIFRWVVMSLVRGPKTFVREAARDAREEGSYIEHVGR